MRQISTNPASPPVELWFPKTLFMVRPDSILDNPGVERLSARFFQVRERSVVGAADAKAPRSAGAHRGRLAHRNRATARPLLYVSAALLRTAESHFPLGGSTHRRRRTRTDGCAGGNGSVACSTTTTAMRLDRGSILFRDTTPLVASSRTVVALLGRVRHAPDRARDLVTLRSRPRLTNQGQLIGAVDVTNVGSIPFADIRAPLCAV